MSLVEFYCKKICNSMEALRYTIESDDRKNCEFVETYYIKFLQTPGNTWSLVISKEGLWPPTWKYKVKIPMGTLPKKLFVSHHLCPCKATQETYQSMRLPWFSHNPSKPQYLFSWLSMYSQDLCIQHWSKKCVLHLKPTQSHIHTNEGQEFFVAGKIYDIQGMIQFESFSFLQENKDSCQYCCHRVVYTLSRQVVKATILW